MLTARAQAKVTGGEVGAAGVIRRMVALGASPPAPDVAPHDWLAGALRAVGSRRLRHPGNHRYAVRIGRSRAERTRISIAVSAQRYPKPSGQLSLTPAPGPAHTVGPPAPCGGAAPAPHRAG